MSKRIPDVHWDAETNTATCVLTDTYDKKYIGIAVCHPDDEDFTSEKTGCEIAVRRAEIEYIKAARDKLKNELGALEHLYYVMNRSKHFNPKSYENIMLQRQIKLKKSDLATIKEMLTTAQENLRWYVDEKEKLYKKLRFNRKVNSEQLKSDEI